MREKLGRLVLLEEVEDGPLGREYRAARLGPAGLDRLVAVLRFGPAVSSHADATRRLVEEARTASQLQNPGLVRVLGIGRVDQSFYVSTELVEGRTLHSILERCHREGFPFATEHALMVASRAASALEYLHSKKDGSGRHLLHGLLAPSRLVVTFDGDVKVKGVGLWPALRGTGLLTAEESVRLAPEQAAGAEGSGLSDVYALGLILLEVLAGRAPGGGDPLSALAHARATSTSGEKGPLPPPLADVLKRSLAADPAARFAGMADFRKAVDALLFSGDFTPTTFDLAFFMHTLFREEMERDAAALEEARRADYGEFLSDAAAASRPSTKGAGAAASPVVAEPAASADAAVDEPAGEGSDGATPVAAAEGHDRATATETAGAATPPGEPGPPRQTPRASRAATREAASRLTFGASTTTSGGRRGLWLALGLLAVAGAGGGLGWLYVDRMRPPAAPPPSTLSAEATAALARVRELEARIADLEREKQEAENHAAEAARRDVEAKAAAGGKAADPASVAAAQEQARRRARAEQETRQEEELRRLAAAKKAEEDRIAAEARAAAMATPTPAPPTPTPTPIPLPMPTPAQALASTPEPVATPPTPPPVRPGDLVDVTDPDVRPPVLVDKGRDPEYPPLALQQKMRGTVQLKLLIDEQGKVVEVKVDRMTPRGFGFDAAAERAVVTRRYRPASKAGVPVRVWLPLTVNFSP